MTRILLHGLVRPGTPRPEGAPKHLRLRAGPLVALATPSDLDPTTEKDTLAIAMVHNSVLSSYATGYDVLPARYGSAHSGIPALLSHVEAETDGLLHHLERLSGHAEFALALERQARSASNGAAAPGGPGPHEPGDAVSGGRAYLARRRAERDTRAGRGHDRDAWIAALLGRVRACVTAIAPAAAKPDRIAALSLLVARRNVNTLAQVLSDEAARASEFGLRIVLTGPWPAYSFCDPGGSSASANARSDGKRVSHG